MSHKTSSKRKLSEKQQLSRKRVKTIKDLPWRKASRPLKAGMGEDDWILELEEVEGVQVTYEETERGRVARFTVDENADSDVGVTSPTDHTEGTTTVHIDEDESYEPFDAQNRLPEWHAFSLHPQLLRALHYMRFSAPTPIQAAALPGALKGKDVIGVAQTGSGKTLAYGLPILHHMLSMPRPRKNERRRVRALVLAPTRELAMQVSSHLNACLTEVKGDEGTTPDEDVSKVSSKGNTKRKMMKSKGPPHASVAAIVGGMSPQKQRRILDRGVDVLVATPGRLWDVVQDNDDLAEAIRALKFLVLDEADRMIEAGHFVELENILRLTLRGHKDDEIPAEFNDIPREEDEEVAERPEADGLQTFVFSATLSKDLQRNLKKRAKILKSNKKGSTLDDLLLRLDFRDPEPEVVDLSPAGGIVSTLQESKMECLATDKDVYLYYFLLRYPGRTLIFLSSIDGIRRLAPLVELLNIKAFPLHSQLEQRQRLKNLDRFKSINNSVLLATDIAARGLDIPAVDHVIHYQVPRTADAYIHRNGRTARAMRKGFALLMCAPDERKIVKGLFTSLGRDESEIPEITFELSLMDKLKSRIQLARQIDVAQHKVRKVNHDRRWMKEAADALGVELDSDDASDLDDQKSSSKTAKAQYAKTAALKAQLKQMLAQPLLARGISAKYITSGSRAIVDDLLAGDFNENMLGVKTTVAGSEMSLARKMIVPIR